MTGLSNFDYLEDFGLRGGDLRKLQLVSDITDITGIQDVKLRDFVHLDFWFYTGRVFDQDRAAFTKHILRETKESPRAAVTCALRPQRSRAQLCAFCRAPRKHGTISTFSSESMDFTQYKEARCLLSYIALKALDPVESEREPGEATGAVWIFYTAPKRIAFGWHV